MNLKQIERDVAKPQKDKKMKGKEYAIKTITTKDKKLPVSNVKSSDKSIKDNITY